MRTPARMLAAAMLAALTALPVGVAQARVADERGQQALERTLAREHHVYRHDHDALAAQEQPTDAVELYRRGERALQEQHTADDATRREGAWMEARQHADTATQTPAPVRPAEPNEQPGWLIVTLGVLAAVLALVAGLAVLAAKRANRRAQVGQTT
jgi:hypothetical protein